MEYHPQVYFVFPYRGVGGVPVLFYRVARYLADKGLADPVLVDFEDGAMANLARDGEVGVSVVYYSEDGELEIPADAYVVFQSMTPWSIFSRIKLDPDTRLLFWNCHPYNLVLFFPVLRFITYRFKKLNRLLGTTFLRSWNTVLLKFIDVIYQNDGLVFMDEENLRNTRAYNDIILNEARFLPIPVEVDNIIAANTNSNEGESIKFAWIGRVVDFKYYPLKRFLLSMNSYANIHSVNFEFSIIGSGPYIEQLKKLSTNLSSVKVCFIGDLPLASMREFIKTKTDIVAAMGTSALEGASVGKPVVLLDLSYKDIPENYRFRWLFETKGFNLAEEVDNTHLSPSGDTFHSLISVYQRDREALGELCRYYVINNHSLDRVAHNLLGFLQGSRLRGSHIAPLQHRSSGGVGGMVYATFKKIRTYFKGK